MPNRELSIYAREFNVNCKGWKNNRGRNLSLLRVKELHFNKLLGEKGELYLNDVYRELGIPEEPKFKNVGWIKDKWGDGYISFYIFEMENIQETVNGEGPNIMLDFNVDGVIRYEPECWY